MRLAEKYIAAFTASESANKSLEAARKFLFVRSNSSFLQALKFLK